MRESLIQILMSVSIQLTILVIKMNDAEIQSGLFIAIVQMVTNKVLEVDGSIVLIWTNVPQTVTISVTKMPGATILMDHMNVTVMLGTMEMVSHAPISTNVNKIKVRDPRSTKSRDRLLLIGPGLSNFSGPGGPGLVLDFLFFLALVRSGP